MEGMYLPNTSPEHHFNGVEQKLRRTTGRLLELMLDRADTGEDPTLTREVVFKQLNAVKDDLPAAQAALDTELLLHPGPVIDQWGFDPRH